MAYSKPSILGWMRKGVFVGAIKGFTDTYNWIVSCFDNVKAGPGLSIDNTENGMPKIGLKLKSGEGIIVEDDSDYVKISVSDVDDIEVVTDVYYDESTHEFSKKTRKVRVITTEDTDEESVVFTAKPHTTES